MISVIIPTYNAERYLPSLLDSLAFQTELHELIVIDSSSSDSTHSILNERRIPFRLIDKASFNHGNTRNYGIDLAKNEIVVMLTQDALLAKPDALESIVAILNSHEENGMAYGRQLPYPNANILSQFARLTNYPSYSRVKSIKDIPKMGIRTCHCSNSFAAYKKKILLSVGGFPSDTILGEDVVVAAKMILAGYKLVYSSEAQVIHSHNYTIIEEFKRYFDIGVFHQQEQLLLRPFAGAESEGVKYIFEEWKFLINNDHMVLIPEQIVRTISKFIGYRFGRLHHRLPSWIKRKASMHKSFWK